MNTQRLDSALGQGLSLLSRRPHEHRNHALGYYHERKDDLRNVGLGPEHDWSSHEADAFGLMAVAYEEPRAGTIRPPRIGPFHNASPTSWMGG
jgi:phage terminase large subunit